MTSRLLVPLFTATIFLSAFLLFVVQPMVGKFLLPLLGGTPSVWNTAMLFFQLLLLAGYIYAHVIAHIRNPKHQALLHIVFMLVASVALPLALPDGNLASSDHPILWQLRTMIGMAAAPFFIMSASAPLLQQWFAHTTHKNAGNPYFLYSASNIGSMLALLTYPVVTEPLFGLTQQSLLWAIGYGALIVLFIACALTSKFTTSPVVESKEIAESLTLKRRLLWIFLAFCPSSLMLGYTSYVTTDVAAVPLFWVIPLALYLGTFIIAFSNRPVIALGKTRMVQGFLLLFLLLVAPGIDHDHQYILLSFHGLLFFFTALMCHQELVGLKPGTSRLTEFYLFISVGGALGGIFNSLISPFLFKFPYEYFLILLVSVFARYASEPLSLSKLKRYRGLAYLQFPGVIILGILLIAIPYSWKYYIVAASALAAGLFLIRQRIPFLITVILIGATTSAAMWASLGKYIWIERNFFGVLHVTDDNSAGLRTLSNGTTSHGAQALDNKFSLIPLTYYNPKSSAGQIFAVLDSQAGPQKVAALGLGIGSIACYKDAKRDFTFYEINPNDIYIAQAPEYFSYLHDCGSPYKILQGDARQEIVKAADGIYDLVFVDVFSSDTIPVHIMTVEAAKIYKSKMKPGGMIVFHISNRFFDLKNEVAALGQAVGMPVLYRHDEGQIVPGTKIKYAANNYAVLTLNEATREKLKKEGWIDALPPSGLRPWSDDYADVIRALK